MKDNTINLLEEAFYGVNNPVFSFGRFNITVARNKLYGSGNISYSHGMTVVSEGSIKCAYLGTHTIKFENN